MEYIGILMVVAGSFGFGFFCRDLNWDWLVKDEPKPVPTPKELAMRRLITPAYPTLDSALWFEKHAGVDWDRDFFEPIAWWRLEDHSV